MSFHSALLAIIFCLMAVSSVPAQSQTPKVDLTKQDKVLTAKDGWQIYATYYPSDKGENAPVVILLHAKGSSRQVWQNGFAERLQKLGYAAVTVDLRKHGQSTTPPGGGTAQSSNDLKPNDYSAMVAFDLEAVKNFLLEEHQKKNLNIRKLAIIAPEMSAPLAMNYTALDWLKRPYPDASSLAARTPRGQDVRALVLISPESSLPRFSTGRATQQLKNPVWNIAIFLGAGSKDSEGAAQVNKLYKQVAAFGKNDQRMYKQLPNSKDRGTDLIFKERKFMGLILAFLEKHLKGLDDAWMDRRSRLER